MNKKKVKPITLHAPQPTNKLVNYCLGLLLQMLNKIRRSVIGYTSAGGSDHLSPQKAMLYNRTVLNGWLQYWNLYAGSEADLWGKNILELGPGADLGLGTLALAKGANAYYALDVFELASGKSDEYYLQGLEHVAEEEHLDTDAFQAIIKETQKSQTRLASRFKYIIRPDFNLEVFEENAVDCVFSNAAFQQFDDPTHTIAQLSKIVRPGGLFLSFIDYTSHTRWIRDRDPLNIYRYPKSIYNLLRFRGSPNRFHTWEYQKALEEHGWVDVEVFNMEAYPQEYLQRIQGSFHKPFDDPRRDMSVATVVICAKRGLDR